MKIGSNLFEMLLNLRIATTKTVHIILCIGYIPFQILSDIPLQVKQTDPIFFFFLH